MSWLFNPLFRFASPSKFRIPHSQLQHVYKLSTKDGPPPSKQSSNEDLLLQTIQTTNTAEDVLQIVGTHYKIMNNRHIMQTLRALYTAQKHEHSLQIANHPNFNDLCYQLKIRSRTMDVTDVVDAVKILSYLKVKSNSTVMQVLLQMIRHDVNDLPIPTIIFLQFLLKFQEKSPLIEALCIALPMVFNVQLPVKIDKENPVALAECLHYASQVNVSRGNVDLIVNCLLKQKNFPVRTALSIVWSLCTFKPRDSFLPLLNKAIDIVEANINSLGFKEIEMTLLKLKNSPWYHHNGKFFDACVEWLVNNDVGRQQALYVLKKFLKVNHFSPTLIDYLSEESLKNPQQFLESNTSEFMNFIAGLTMTDYRPLSIDDLRSLISQYKVNLGANVPWVRLAAGLANLDVYDEEILRKCFDPECMATVLENHRQDVETYVTLWQAVKVFSPENEHLLPTREAMAEFFDNARPSEDYPLHGALDRAIGGAGYVRTGLKTKFGHHVDHVIVMRSGGYPVACKDDSPVEFIEDLQTSEDNQILAIIALHPSCFVTNCERIQGLHSLRLRTLEKLGYYVAPVSISKWRNLLDYEKIPYLMRVINQKNDGRSVSVL